MKFSHSTNGFYIEAIHGDSIPADAVEINSDEHTALLDGQSLGKIIVASPGGYPILIDPPPQSIEQVIKSFTVAIQKRIDDFAQSRGYDNILSACTYATSSVQKFATEGQYCVNARDITWSAANEILTDVQSESRPVPTIEEVLSELPVLEWPA